jgi:hypothetical protein
VLADRPGDSAGVAAVHDVAASVSVYFVDAKGVPLA